MACIILLSLHKDTNIKTWKYCVAFFALLIPCSEIVISIFNWSINKLTEPRFISKLEFSEDIPEEFSTIVVIPTLLNSEKRVHDLASDMEVCYLANQEKNLSFAILGDFIDSNLEHEENDDKIILGWSGSHSTSNYLYLLTNVLLELKKKVDFKLLVMGDDSFDIDGLEIEAIKWSEEKEIAQLQRMDIGLYPLPLNEEWVLGKSGLKAIQYCALGIPTIATDVGCNDRVILNNETGYLVKTEEEWLQKLLLLIKDNSLRKKIGLAAREHISKNYSINANKDTYLKILNEVARN